VSGARVRDPQQLRPCLELGAIEAGNGANVLRLAEPRSGNPPFLLHPMKYLDLTLPTPEQNLACDEALLDLCESGYPDEIIRFWEPGNYFVVLGYANKFREEVNLEVCRAQEVSVLRRCSGGGTVVQGPGCLNYTLILRINRSPSLLSITETNAFIMNVQKKALDSILTKAVTIQGHTDLALGHMKFSGNAQRRRRDFLIFHGTFLLNFDLALVEQLLPIPAKQPPYRKNRAHTDFLMNLSVSADLVKDALKRVWNAAEVFDSVPGPAVAQFVDDKYSRPEWNYRF
jgi:lipoate-protein ligase A